LTPGVSFAGTAAATSVIGNLVGSVELVAMSGRRDALELIGRSWGDVGLRASFEE